MPSYYTYGEMPDAEETVYGPLDVYREGIMPPDESVPFYDASIPDERETIQPTDEVEPVYTPEVQGGLETIQPTDEGAPIPDSAAQSGRETTQPTYEQAPVTPPPAPVSQPPALSYFDPGLTTSVTPTGSTLDAGQKAMALASLIDPTLIKGIGVGDAAFGGAGDSGTAVADYYRAVAPDTVGGQGALYEEGALEAAKKAAVDPTQGLFKSGFEALAGEPGIAEAIQAKTERDLGALAKVESDYAVMKPISDLLKANKFEQAFDYAKEKGVVDKMMSPGWLEQLRQPFTAQEMKAFYKAIPPDYRGSEYSFTPDAAPVSESGYPEPLSAFQSKDQLTAIDAIIRLGGAAVLGAGALSALGGAGAAGGASSIGSTIKSVYQTIAAIPGQIGGTVASALNLPINSALAQTAFGNSLISAATTAAKGGDIGDILKAGLLAAGVTYGLDAAVNAVKGMMPEVSQSVSGEVAKAAANTGVSSSTAFDALQEIVVTGKRLSDVAGLGGAVAGVTRGLGEPSAEPKPEDLQEVTVTGTRVPVPGAPVGALVTPKPETTPEVKAPLSEEAPPEDLEEVKVTATRPEVPPVVVSPPPPAPPSPIETTAPEPVEDLEEVTVTGRRIEQPPVVVPPPPSQPRGLDVFEPEPVEDLEEVTVTGRRIEQPPVVVPPPPAVKTGPIDVTAPETPIEEFTVTGKRDLDVTEPPAIVVKTPDIAKDYKPTEVVDSDKFTLEKLLEKYGTLENLLKLLGILGGAASGSGGATTGGTMPSLGGALPVYDIKRTELRPDIDYYTYGTRPEVKFFDYGDQVFVPVKEPPPAEIINTKPITPAIKKAVLTINDCVTRCASMAG